MFTKDGGQLIVSLGAEIVDAGCSEGIVAGALVVFGVGAGEAKGGRDAVEEERTGLGLRGVGLLQVERRWLSQEEISFEDVVLVGDGLD